MHRKSILRILFTAFLLTIAIASAHHFFAVTPVKADPTPGADRKLVGTWEDSVSGTPVDYTLAPDGTFYLASVPDYWAIGTWKIDTGILTLTAKEGSKSVEIGKPINWPVLFNDDSILVVKIEQAKGEENEKDFLMTFKRVK